MISFDELGLPEKASLLVDTAPIIYFIEGPCSSAVDMKARYEVARLFFDEARKGSLRLIASTVAWTEVLERPAMGDLPKATPERGGSEAAEGKAVAYRRLLSDSSSVCIAPVDVAIAEEAARLIAASRRGPTKGPRRSLELADALHLATAVVLGVDAILTNDGAFRSALRDLARPPRILLVDELAFDAD
jgi:predicted nucleic acid-binding protein